MKPPLRPVDAVGSTSPAQRVDELSADLWRARCDDCSALLDAGTEDLAWDWLDAHRCGSDPALIPVQPRP